MSIFEYLVSKHDEIVKRVSASQLFGIDKMRALAIVNEYSNFILGYIEIYNNNINYFRLEHSEDEDIKYLNDEEMGPIANPDIPDFDAKFVTFLNDKIKYYLDEIKSDEVRIMELEQSRDRNVYENLREIRGDIRSSAASVKICEVLISLFAKEKDEELYR